MNLSDYLKIISKFNTIKFYDESHSYFFDNKQVISVTGFIGKFEHEFVEDEHLQRMVREGKIKPDQVELTRYKWRYANKHALYEGKSLHRFLENLMVNKEVTEETEYISGDAIIGNIPFSDISNTYYTMKRQAYKFYEEYVLSGKLIPVANELVIGSVELGLTGQLDQLFYNTEIDALQVWDWKTNDRYEYDNKYNTFLKAPVSHLAQCSHNIYSIQLELYNTLLRSAGLDVHPDNFIVWFGDRDSDMPHVIQCKDMRKEVGSMLAFKKENPEDFKVRPFDRPVMPEEEMAPSMGNLLSL